MTKVALCILEVSKMKELSKTLKGLYILAMVNVGMYALGMIVLVFLLQKGGNLKGMYVILASGIAVGIQIIALISKLRKSDQ